MNALFNYLKRNQARFVQELCDSVRFPSVSAQAQHRPDSLAAAQWQVTPSPQIGLETRLYPTKRHPVVVAKTQGRSPGHQRPHFLVYGHYDVQPPEPFDLWKSPPFEPRRQGRSL